MARSCRRRHAGDPLEVLYGPDTISLCTECVQEHVEERAAMSDDGAKATLLHHAHQRNQMVLYSVLWVYRTSIEAGGLDDPVTQAIRRARE